MKSIILACTPAECEKIVNGDMSILVRKKVPKEVPFKAFIYVTKGKPYLYRVDDDNNFELTNTLRPKTDEYVKDYNEQNGKVIGEFVCDRVYKWECKNRLEILESFPIWRASYMLFVDDLEKTCLTYDDLWKYGKGKPLYGLHISDLKIYDKPKELGEFNRPCSYVGLCFSCDRAKFTSKGDRICQAMITRPPQNYIYVNDLGE